MFTVSSRVNCVLFLVLPFVCPKRLSSLLFPLCDLSWDKKDRFVKCELHTGHNYTISSNFHNEFYFRLVHWYYFFSLTVISSFELSISHKWSNLYSNSFNRSQIQCIYFETWVHSYDPPNDCYQTCIYVCPYIFSYAYMKQTVC